MNSSVRNMAILVCSISTVPVLLAQRPTDPSGRWEGTLNAPQTTLNFSVDLARNERGEWTGAISVPAQRLKGLPLRTVMVEGTSLTFSPRTDQTFKAVLAGDGSSMSGNLHVSDVSAPFTLTRTGDAVIEARPSSPAISRALAGTWNGSLRAGDRQLRFVLTLTNHADGSASGSLVNVDEGGLELPVAITQNGAEVTLETRAIEASFTGALSASETELAGTFRQAAMELPMTFTKH